MFQIKILSDGFLLNNKISMKIVISGKPGHTQISTTSLFNGNL